MKTTIFKADYFGAVASFLCLLHCLATPFVFVAKACTLTCCENTPVWWKSVDYVFLMISFVAIYYSTKSSTKRWVAPALWGAWTSLLLIIVNESVGLIHLPNEMIYLPAISIVGLHLYNQRYCKCSENSCCVN